MKATKNIQASRIDTGAARDEGRAPSHDGEYMTLFYVPGESDWILEGNGGVVTTDDDPRPGGTDDDPQWESMLAEVLDDIAKGHGGEATSCGHEASGLMEQIGWLTDDGEACLIRRVEPLRPYCFEAHCLGTVYDDGGFDYRIQPQNWGGTDAEAERWARRAASCLSRSAGQVVPVEGYVDADGIAHDRA